MEFKDARALYVKDPKALLEKSCPTVDLQVDFIKRVMQQFKAVIGLSGGLDSAVVAALAANAIGKENVYAIMMPSATSPSLDLEYAEKQAKRLGINYEVFPIEKIISAIEKARPNQQYFKHKIQKGNLQSRVRMSILYDKAWQLNGLVLGTTNLSEYATGYFTKFGDGAADIEPILNLYKTQVRQIAEKLEIVEEIKQRKPTAALWEGQTDEEELGMDYETLDKILIGLELKFDIEEILKINGLARAQVESIFLRIKANEHKRKLPLAPAPKFI